MKKALFLTLMAILAFSAQKVHASDARPDDQVVFDLSAETWVTTKTVQLDLSVEATVTNQGSEGTLRAAMQNAVANAAKGDWRLTSFTRSQDQSGLERWSATYQARLPEDELNGIQEKVKRISKPGMQIRVVGVSFTPTTEEIEAAQANLRTDLYKKANEQLATLNSTLPGRGFRIGLIDFSNQTAPLMRQMMAVNKMMAEDSASSSMPGGMERAQKMMVKAHVVMMAVPPAAK